MIYPPYFGDAIYNLIKPHIDGDEPAYKRLYTVSEILNRAQGIVLSQVIREHIGDKVYEGPFKGMIMSPDTMIGHFSSYLLGTYEHELRPTIAKIIATPYQQILNIGCAFGYYSVGLARLMPQVKVYSFDTDEDVRKKCTNMAKANGVEDRVIISGYFPGEDFAKYAGPKTLVIMDIEGGERELLDPQLYPALKNMDVLVEMHDCFDQNISTKLIERFKPTHEIEAVQNEPSSFDLTAIYTPGAYIHHLDPALATWEGRSGPTPWGFFTVKQ